LATSLTGVALVAELVLTLCGPVALTGGTDAPADFHLGGKTLALLAYLTLEARPHRREELTALLWGESPEVKARASLRHALMQLRTVLGDRLRADRTSV